MGNAETGKNYGQDQAKKPKESGKSGLSPEMLAKLEAQVFKVGQNLNRVDQDAKLSPWTVISVDEARHKIGVEKSVKNPGEHATGVSLDRHKLALEQVALPHVADLNPYFDAAVESLVDKKKFVSDPDAARQAAQKFRREIVLNTVIDILDRDPDLSRNYSESEIVGTMAKVTRLVLTEFLKEHRATPKHPKVETDYNVLKDRKYESLEKYALPDIIGVTQESYQAINETEVALQQAQDPIRQAVRASLVANGFSEADADHYLLPYINPEADKQPRQGAEEAPSFSDDIYLVSSTELDKIMQDRTEVEMEIEDVDKTLSGLPLDGVRPLTAKMAEELEAMMKIRAERSVSGAKSLALSTFSLEKAIEDTKNKPPEKRAIIKATLRRDQQAMSEFKDLNIGVIKVAAKHRHRLLEIRQAFMKDRAKVQGEIASEYPPGNQDWELVERIANIAAKLDEMATVHNQTPPEIGDDDTTEEYPDVKRKKKV